MEQEANIGSNKDYLALLQDIKSHIHHSRLKAALAVNRELLNFYWGLGQRILERQRKSRWGDKLITLLSRDLQAAFPDSKGFSPTNLKYMRIFAETYPDFQIGQTLSNQLPWSHHVALLRFTKSNEERSWYCHKVVEECWSFRKLIEQIKKHTYQRQALLENKTTNFREHLSKAQSELAQETLKDPYKFDFLTVGQNAKELEIERALVKHIKEFLLELGKGFAFVGSQYPLRISSQDYRIDLLFYHVKLYCYIVIELKVGKLKPTHGSQLNFYLSAVDDLIKGPNDNPTIGLLLCEEKDKVIAEYTLRDINKPIGISHYELMRILPEKLQIELPAIEEIEARLNSEREQLPMQKEELEITT